MLALLKVFCATLLSPAIRCMTSICDVEPTHSGILVLIVLTWLETSGSKLYWSLMPQKEPRHVWQKDVFGWKARVTLKSQRLSMLSTCKHRKWNLWYSFQLPDYLQDDGVAARSPKTPKIRHTKIPIDERTHTVCWTMSTGYQVSKSTTKFMFLGVCTQFSRYEVDSTEDYMNV